jgi:zinc-ribbon domain
MPSLFKRLRGGRGDSDPERPAPPRRRRYLPPPSRLRRERRALLDYRERRIHDLGGLVLEMYRQDQFRQDVVHEQAAEIVALEERVREVDRLLTARTGRGERTIRCSRCGTPLYAGARFCPSCGQPLEAAGKT